MEKINALRHELAGIFTEGRGSILIMTAAGWFLARGVRMVFPVLLPYLRRAHTLDLSAAGLLLTILYLCYGAGQLPSGIFVDKFGERFMLTASAVVSATTIGLVIFAESTIILFVSAGLFGFGVSLYSVSRYTVLAPIYPDRLGVANGVVSASSDAGQSLLPPLAGFLAAAFAWQLGLAITIPFFLIVAIGLWWTLPDTRDRNSSGTTILSKNRFNKVVVELKTPAIFKGTVALVLGISLWQAFTSFYPTYLVEIKGVSETVAGVLFGFFFLLGIGVQPTAGTLLDRVGLSRTTSIVMGIASIGLFTLPFISNFRLLIAITILCSSLLGFGTITQSYLIELLNKEVRGTAFGVIRTISFTIGAASPVLFGIIAEHNYFDEGFILLGIVSISTIIVSRV